MDKMTSSVFFCLVLVVWGQNLYIQILITRFDNKYTAPSCFFNYISSLKPLSATVLNSAQFKVSSCAVDPYKRIFSTDYLLSIYLYYLPSHRIGL